MKKFLSKVSAIMEYRLARIFLSIAVLLLLISFPLIIAKIVIFLIFLSGVFMFLSLFYEVVVKILFVETFWAWVQEGK